MNEVQVELVSVKCSPGRPSQRSRRVRIYLHQDETSPAMEIATLERYNKPYRELKRLYWDEILKRAKMPAGTRGVWNPRAGCFCRCSPGFVTDFEGDFSVHVTYRYRRVRDSRVVTRRVNPKMKAALRRQLVPI